MICAAGYKPDSALPVFGNDQINFDSQSALPEHATGQNDDSRYREVAVVSIDSVRRSSTRLGFATGELEVWMVPGDKGACQPGGSEECSRRFIDPTN